MRNFALIGLSAAVLMGCPSGDECPNGVVSADDPTCGCAAFPNDPFCQDDPCPDGYDADNAECDDCNDFPNDPACQLVDTPDTIAEARTITPTFGEAVDWTETIFEPGDRDMYSIGQSVGNWYFVWANRPGTEPDGSPSGGNPDTVVRMYTGDGTEIATNDDMPFRYENTDAGMWWQATSDDPVFVEVLEWADWRNDLGESETPIGGDQVSYQLVVVETDLAETVGANNTMEECFAGTESSFGALGLSAQNMVFGNGLIDSGTDVDYFQLGFEGFTSLPEDSELLCQFGFWPEQPSDLTPLVRLYWEDCTPGADDDGDCDGTGDDVYLLGESEEPDFTPTGIFLSEDPAVTGVISDGRYYVEVSSATGEGGPGHYYTLLYSCYNTTNFQEENETASVDANDATIVPLDNPNSPDFYFGRFYGDFVPKSGALSADDFDAFAITDGLGDGRYLTVEIESADAGSLTGDITMTLWRNNGGGDFVELTSITGPDPQLVDYELTGDDLALVVTLQTDGSVQDFSTGYYGLAFTSADPS